MAEEEKVPVGDLLHFEGDKDNLVCKLNKGLCDSYITKTVLDYVHASGAEKEIAKAKVMTICDLVFLHSKDGFNTRFDLWKLLTNNAPEIWTLYRPQLAKAHKGVSKNVSNKELRNVKV